MNTTNLLHNIYILLVVGSALLVTSCARQIDPRSFKSPHEEVQEYYERFHEYYGINPFYVAAGFVEEVKGEGNSCAAVAICRLYSSGHREIIIEGPYWDTLGDYGKEQMIFHELGHCILGRDHDESKRDNGCSASIMNPYLFGDSWCYSDYRDELILNLGELYE